MRVVHADEIPYKKPRTNHREGDIEFKRLRKGRPGGVKNFEFLIAKTGGRFFGPRHRHNFEQIRLGLSGTLGKGHRAWFSGGPSASQIWWARAAMRSRLL